jgi:ATP-dependent RNA helicase DDX24/MAK5
MSSSDEIAKVKFDSSLLPEWASMSLHPMISQGLLTLAFTKPTPIQKAALPVAGEGRDIVGIAETGSGKTLAYSLPILHHILSQTSIPDLTSKRKLTALILAPTRELALQVCEHLKAFVSAGAGSSNGRVPSVSIAAIVGGLSLQKQRRLIERGANILVATPGRLWDVLGEVCFALALLGAKVIYSVAHRMMVLPVKSAIHASWCWMRPTVWLKQVIFKN